MVQTESLDQITPLSVAQTIRRGEEQVRADNPIRPNELAAGMLLAELRRQLQERKSLRMIHDALFSHAYSSHRIDFEHPPMAAGIHAWDEAFAHDLEASLGPEGERVAGTIRVRAHLRAAMFARDGNPVPMWRLWNIDPDQDCCPYITLLGIAVWAAFVREEYLEFIEKPPALMAPIMANVAMAHQRGVHLVENGESPPSLLTKDDRHLAIMERRHTDLLPPIPKIDAKIAVAVLQQSVPALTSLAAQRVIRWEIFTGHKQRAMTDPRKINIPDGWPYIAEQIGLQDHNAPEQVRMIVLAQAHMCFRLPGKRERYGNLLSYIEQPAAGRETSHVQLVLGTILMPGHIHDYAKEDFEWPSEYFSARKLVPVLELPPFVGRPADWEPQAAFSGWLTIEMRNQARLIEQQGSASINDEQMRELAARAALPQTLLHAVLDRWTQDGNDGPAFLLRPSPDHYTLAKNNEVAWQYIVTAGKTENAASRSGKRKITQRWRWAKSRAEKYAKSNRATERKRRKK